MRLIEMNTRLVSKILRLALLLIFSLPLYAVGEVFAQEYEFSTANTWAVTTPDPHTVTDTLSGIWTLPSDAGGRYSGAILSTGTGKSTNLGTIDLSGSILAGSQFLYGMKSDGLAEMVNEGTISVIGTSGQFSVRGLYVDTGSSDLTNSGTIKTIAYGTGSSQGIFYRPNTGSHLFSNSGNITSIAHNDWSRGIFVGSDRTSSVTAENYGIVAATSHAANDYAYGAFIHGDSSGFLNFSNTGSLSAVTSGSGKACAAYIEGSGAGSLTFYNTGSLSATASGSGSAYAVYAVRDADIHLQTGTEILGGEVYSRVTSNNLYLDGTGTVDFDITGAWGVLDKTGSGTWTVGKSIAASIGTLGVNKGSLKLDQGITATVTTVNLSSGATLDFAPSSMLTATGTATLDGTIQVDPAAASVGTTTVLSAGTLNTGANYKAVNTNTNFTVNISTTPGAGGTVTATTSFTPHDDQSSLATNVILSSAQAFAGVAQVRSLTQLAEADEIGDDERVMVATNGSLAGLLNPKRPEEQWNVFLQPVVSTVSRDSDASSAGYDSDMFGLEAGLDRRFGDNWVLGAMAGIGKASIDFNGSNFVDSNSERQEIYTAGVYGGYQLGDWMFTDTLSVNYATHDLKRNAGLGQTANADYDSWLTSNQLLAIYKLRPSEQWEIAPRAGFNVSWLHRDSFSETGATNAVSYDDLNKTFADALLGVYTSYDVYQVEDKFITPYLGAGVVHALVNGDITVRQYLPTVSALVTSKSDTDRFTAECGVTFGKGAISFTLAYNGEYGETTDSHTVFGKWRWAF